MTANSYTGTISTNGEYKTITELTGLTLISGNTYSVQIQNQAKLKIANAIFDLCNEKFTLTASEDDVYIKTTTTRAVILTILENA